MNQKLDEIFGTRRCETCKTEITSPNGVMPKHERLWCPMCLVQRKSASIGERIRTFRWAASLTQEELSGRTRISVENIRSFESKRKEPSETQLARLIEGRAEELVSNFADKTAPR